MVTAGDPGSQIINIDAEIQAGGVYPLVIQTGINPELEKIPLQVKVFAGTPFYYRLGDGDMLYSDGTKDMMLGLVHPVWGVKNIRLVAIANEGEATFKAEIRSIDFSGTWSINIFKDSTVKNISCDESNRVWVAEYAALSMPALVLRMGDFYPNSSFSDLDLESKPNALGFLYCRSGSYHINSGCNAQRSLISGCSERNYVANVVYRTRRSAI